MASEEKLDNAYLLLLPEDLLNSVGSWLDDQELCNMELANRELHHALTSPSHPGPGERRLDIGARFDGNRPPSPDASRWLLKRVKRYKHIACVFRDLNSVVKELNEGITTCSLPSLLPSLLAGCASTAQLSLSLGLREGAKFLAMLLGGDPPSAVLNPSLFREELRKHLTELSLLLYPHEAQCFGNVGMLTALQRLELLPMEGVWCGPVRRKLAGQKLDLKLPHLVSLRLFYLENGELVLTCPKLAEAQLQGMASMRIEVKEAAMNRLVLHGCGGVQNLVESLKDKLQSLESLSIDYCADVGRQIIEDLCQMTSVQTLEFRNFTAACLPRSFPQSLLKLKMFTFYKWHVSLPEGLKELHRLKSFQCDVERAWEITRPLEELLPVDNLEEIQLGCHTLDCTGAKAWRSEGLPKDVLKCADRRSEYRCQHKYGHMQMEGTPFALASKSMRLGV